MKEIITKIEIDKKFLYKIEKDGSVSKQPYHFWLAPEFKWVIIMLILLATFYVYNFQNKECNKCIMTLNNPDNLKPVCDNLTLYINSKCSANSLNSICGVNGLNITIGNLNG